MIEKVRRSLHRCLTKLLDRSGGMALDRKALASRLGVNYRSLSYWLSSDRSLPAEYIPGICIAAADYSLLDVLEAQVGRVAFKLPSTPQGSQDATLIEIQRLIQSVGTALESVGETLLDGVVEERELQDTLPKLDAVVRECALLRHLLEGQCKSSQTQGTPAGVTKARPRTNLT
jgi:hypothetical protein